MTYFKTVITACMTLASISSAAHAAETSKSAVIEILNGEITKKSKPWDELATDLQSKNYTYWQNCETLKATHCHTYELSHRKVNGRVSMVMRTFDKACLDNGGITVNGEDPSYDTLDKFFYDNHNVVKRIHIPVKTQQLFCEFEGRPALSVFVDSERAQRHGDGNLFSKEALYEKPRIFVYIHDLDALAPHLEQARKVTKTNTEISMACMAAPLKIGDRSQFGLVTNVRGPLVEIQRERGLEWVRADEVKRDIRECEVR